MTTSPMPIPIGSTAQPGDVFFAIMPWMLILVGIVLVGWLLLVMIRRSARDSDSALDDGFTLGQLRRMRERGELDDEEFEQARSVILGHHAPRPTDLPPSVPKSDTPPAGTNGVPED